jgi:hypothetical protein
MSDDIVPYILFIICGMILGGSVGGCAATSYMKEEAVRIHHAEWVSDTNGKPQFRWKECK